MAMQADSQAPSKRTNRLQKVLLLAFVGIPLGIVCGELVMRGALAANGGLYDPDTIRLNLAELRSRLVDSLPRPGADRETEQEDSANTKIIHPFVGFDDLLTMSQMEEDLRSHRELNPETYRILILGGSVAGLFGLQGTGRLAELLEQDPRLNGRKVEFMTYARGGHKQPQQILRLVHLLTSGIRANAVLNIDGFNEVAIGNYNRSRKTYPTYPSYNHWMRFMQALDENPEQRKRFSLAMDRNQDLIECIDSALDRAWFGSTLWTCWTQFSITRKRVQCDALRDQYMQILSEGEVSPGALGPSFQGKAQRAVKVCVESWFESSRQINVLCDTYGMDYLHVLQPTLHDPGAKPMAPREIERGGIEQSWKQGVLLGYPAMRAGGQLLSDQGIHFLDASMIFEDVTEPLYYDNCHFRKKGVTMLANAIATGFEDVLSR
ncbi:MAG: hypothetical protein ACI9F9_001677 [Candidatus Paceibacteria bacterium]|jgi:hypothetical protein